MKLDINGSLKALVNRHHLLQQCSASMRYNRFARHKRRQQHYAALNELCVALRQIRNSTTTTRHFEAVRNLIESTCYCGGRLIRHNDNVFYREFLASSGFQKLSTTYKQYPLTDRVRIRHPRDGVDPGREGNLIVLKAPNRTTGERGVILFKYNYTFDAFAALFDLSELQRLYQFVFEPSWAFNYLASVFLYLGDETQGVIQSQHDEDFRFFSECHPCLVPIRLCASDWVDSELFRPKHGSRQYDVVIVSAWWTVKRHDVIFRALSSLRHRRLKIALIGYPMDRTQADIRQLSRMYGLEAQCNWFERIPAQQVAEIVADARVSVLFSLQEGNPKAPYEALFCDTPIILHEDNVGLRQSTVNGQTGLLASDASLADAIGYILDNPREFQPRAWAEAHSGYKNSTAVLNRGLKEMALGHNEPWTRDIVPKVNRPHLRYASVTDQATMEPVYKELQSYLRN